MSISFDCTHDCKFCSKELCDERIESVDIVDIEQFWNRLMSVPHLLGKTLMWTNICNSSKTTTMIDGNEYWCDIKGFEGIYQVSNYGRIRRNDTRQYIRQYFHEKGYLKVDLYRNGYRKKFRVHRLVAEHFLENPNNYPQVNHINGIKTDNRAVNLEWCTNRMNCLHAIRIGLRPIKHKKYPNYE